MSAPSPLEGTWRILKGDLAGEIMPDFVAERIELELDAGTYTVRFSGTESDRGTYELLEGGPFAALKLVGVEGVNAGRTIPAIFQLAGNRLRVCYGLDGVLPTAFDTAGPQKLFLATYQRFSRAAKT